MGLRRADGEQQTSVPGLNSAAGAHSHDMRVLSITVSFCVTAAVRQAQLAGSEWMGRGCKDPRRRRDDSRRRFRWALQQKHATEDRL